MLCAVLAGVQERVSAKADGKRMAETLGPQERVSAKADGKRMAETLGPQERVSAKADGKRMTEAYTPKARKPEARRPDERGGTYKRPRIDEGGSSSGRMKRKANFSCVNPTCRLLDEFPVSVMAQHCGVCVCFFFYYVCRDWLYLTHDWLAQAIPPACAASAGSLISLRSKAGRPYSSLRSSGTARSPKSKSRTTSARL